jgi:DNA-binding MltR family transcriptional regulator
MSTPVEEFIQRQFQQILAFRKALTQESDRGCALFAAAYLDNALFDLLYRSLVENKNVGADLFQGTAPLANFSARIKFAFYLGKLSAPCRADLDTIRKIRNRFAHDAELISFDSQSVGDLCQNLVFSYHVKEELPRAHFTAAALGILAKIHLETLQSVAPSQKPDDSPSNAEKKTAREKVQEMMKDLEGV